MTERDILGTLYGANGPVLVLVVVLIVSIMVLVGLYLEQEG